MNAPNAINELNELNALNVPDEPECPMSRADPECFCARPRFTKDLDVLVKPDLKNGKKIIKALREFGFQSPDLSENDFSREGKIIQLGYEPVRVDIITSIDGCTFEEIWKNRKAGSYGKQKVSFIGIKELIKNKKVTGRRQDEADLEILKKVKSARIK